MIGFQEPHPGVHWLELQRPDRHNALTDEMYDFLAERLNTAAATARAVVLSGAGPSFCAGNDRKEFETRWPQPPYGPVYRFLKALHGLEIPVMAAVHGAAVGIGATMLLHCDVVYAAPDAFLQFPFVDLGLTVEGGSSYLLPRLIGRAKAMEILLSCRRLPAAEALALGIVSDVRDDPVAGVLALAGRVADRPQDAVAATKRLVRQGLDGRLPELFETEISEVNRLILARR